MIRLLTAVLLFASFHAVADTEVPHKFQQGEVIDAQKFNEDFDALEAAIDANAAALPPTNCTTDQIIVHRNGAWVCSSPQVMTDFVMLENNTFEVYCSGGQKVTGGGCTMRGADMCDLEESRPLIDRSGWLCRMGGCRVPWAIVSHAYAICQ